jgi:TIR domain
MKLFITYASEDRPSADQLAVRLRTEGHTVFLDRDNLPEGEGYDAQIRAAIADCDLYVFLISPRSVQPGRYTLTELKFARERFPNPRGRVLPVMCEATPFSDIPPYLSAVTVLQPQGNLVAEALAEVRVMENRSGPEKPPAVTGAAAASTPEATAGRSWWTTLPGVLTGAAAVITAATGLVALFAQKEEPAPPPSIQQAAGLPSSTPNMPPAQRQLAPAPAAQTLPALPRVVLDGPTQVSFEKFPPSTYTVLNVETQPRTPTHYGLRFRIRMFNRGSYDTNFWDSRFRLLIDGVPSAPDSGLNELVSGNAAKEGVVSFEVPNGARELALRIIHQQDSGEIADLPLRIVSGETPAKPSQTQAGSQSVSTGDIGAGARVNIQQRQ